MIDASTPGDPAAFEPAMPDAVREVIAQARRGEGVAAQWLARPPGGWGRVGDCFVILANRPDVSAEIAGWIAGITMFDDESQRLPAVLKRRSHRDDAIPYVLEAVAAGVRAGVPASGRLWTSVEMLAVRVATVPAGVVDVLAIGAVSQSALARGAALRLAQRIGAPAVAALETARASAPASHARLLDDMLAALAGSAAAKPASTEDAQLLARMLEAWRATRDRELEGPIVRLGGELGRARGELVARSKGELEGAWRALAASQDPADASRLLDAPWPPVWKTAIVRVEALAGFPPDPRISIGLAELARTYESKGSYPLHVAIAKVLLQAPTAAIVPSLDAIEAARTSPTTASIYARVRRAIEALQPVPADPDLVAEAHARDAAVVDLAALYAEHAANPADLTARAVLADALQLAGDPRGEFIALQLAIANGAVDPRARKREATLLAAHGDAWTGPLPGVERASRRFERGFLVAARTTADPHVLARSIDRSEWITVEELAVTVPGGDLAPLVRRMPLLRVLAAPPQTLDRLAESGPHPGIRAIHSPNGWLPRAGAFPDLRVVGGGWFTNEWTAERFAEVQRAAAELGVHAIVHTGFLMVYLARAIQAAASGPPETRFAFDRGQGFAGADWRIRVRRGDPVVAIAMGAREQADPNDRVFDALRAAGCTRLALYASDALRAAHADRLAGFELVPGEPVDLAE